MDGCNGPFNTKGTLQGVTGNNNDGPAESRCGDLQSTIHPPICKKFTTLSYPSLQQRMFVVQFVVLQGHGRFCHGGRQPNYEDTATFMPSIYTWVEVDRYGSVQGLKTDYLHPTYPELSVKQSKSPPH